MDPHYPESISKSIVKNENGNHRRFETYSAYESTRYSPSCSTI